LCSRAKQSLAALYNRRDPDNKSPNTLGLGHGGAWTSVSAPNNRSSSLSTVRVENGWEIGMKLNAFAAVALLVGLVFASSVYSQPAQTERTRGTIIS
jgi:hypothetical protein